MKLFLDDVRSPEDCFGYVKAYGIRPDVYTGDWKIVRDYKAFVSFIENNGIPEEVSFDHDLAYIHYDPETWKEGFEYMEETGYDCAKWLVQHCQEKGVDLPKCYCHSMNPIGRERINRFLCQAMKQ